jgi:hypothetical protein
MSGTGPESIPTSADPRSKRPTKRRALSPKSAQAATLDALFAKPDQEIRLPPPVGSVEAASRRTRPVPEIVTNVQGSSAGAGSGEFHVYKAARRREQERVRVMDAEVAKEQAGAEFERAKREREAKDEEKTRRNREKREKKMKARQKAKGRQGDGEADDGMPATKGVVARGVARCQEDGHGDGAQDDEMRGTAVATTELGLLIRDDD